MNAKTCTLRAAAGAGEELCPGGRCAFWEGGCVVEDLRIPLDNPDVARHLLQLRLALEEGRADEERETRRRLAELLNLNRE